MTRSARLPATGEARAGNYAGDLGTGCRDGSSSRTLSLQELPAVPGHSRRCTPGEPVSAPQARFTRRPITAFSRDKRGGWRPAIGQQCRAPLLEQDGARKNCQAQNSGVPPFCRSYERSSIISTIKCTEAAQALANTCTASHLRVPSRMLFTDVDASASREAEA